LAIIDPYTQLRETGALDVNPVKYTPLQSFLDAPKYIDAYSEAHDLGSKMWSMYSWAGAGEGTYGKQGLSSDVRHTLGSSAGKDAIIDWASTNLGIDPYGKFADVIGNVGITGATALEEIPDAWRSFKQALGEGDYGAITSGGILAQPWEDVQANLNAWGIPYGATLEQKKSYVPQLRFKQQQLMNRRKQQMQETIRQHEAAEAAKQKAAADAAAAAAAAKQKFSGQGAQGGGGGANIGGGQQTSSGIAGGAVSHGAAKAARGDMSGWGLADGGLINFYRYGGFSG